MQASEQVIKFRKKYLEAKDKEKVRNEIERAIAKEEDAARKISLEIAMGSFSFPQQLAMKCRQDDKKHEVTQLRAILTKV